MNTIISSAVISGLIQMVLHWFPWRMIMGHGIPRILAYILGVLGIVLPLSALFIQWQQVGVVPDEWQHLLALWACVLSSGLAVIAAYGFDWVLNRVRKSYEHEELDNAKARRE